MAHIVSPLDQPSNYKDSQSRVDRQTQNELLAKSSTLYVGNLSFYTTEEQIYELFSKCTSPEDGGGIKRIIMGLDRNTRTPCGFCFVEYYTHAEALACLRYISGTKLDERIIRCDIDLGYRDGRQFGRGKSGGQVRDEHRQDYDPGRGGWGLRPSGWRRSAGGRSRSGTTMLRTCLAPLLEEAETGRQSMCRRPLRLSAAGPLKTKPMEGVGYVESWNRSFTH
ncbi:hypothetical protein BD413DRAFT_464629 [Trametes elegans]|nr:hypothetical protein BD413DRAFT_464629 [Trametes elegans]